MSVLRQMIARGDKVSIGSEITITPASGKEVPADWLEKHSAKINEDARAICGKVIVETDDLADFFNSGKKLPREQTTAEWLGDYDGAYAAGDRCAALVYVPDGGNDSGGFGDSEIPY